MFIIYCGSVGKHEPKWRSFWEWSDTQQSTDDDDDDSNDESRHEATCIAPAESQSSYSSSPPPPLDTTIPDDGKDVTFEQLSDDDKKIIYEWAVNREGTVWFKRKALELFETYAASDSALDWEPQVVDPLWFRIQSAGSMLHTDTPYIVKHTTLLSNASGQKLMISGIDMMHKATFIGKKSKILKQKLSKINDENSNNDCRWCCYVYSEGDDGGDDNEDNNENNNRLCESCCDSRFGIYTVWTALDYFDSPFNSGSMIFALGSHSKYKGMYEAMSSEEAVPNGYSSKSRSDKTNNMR